ncbi:hypothetical protein DSO57_1019733 [Entomophthora muscae]|uniref:Uncharacterized protein n=1 Tax=Entomophthora muscae TaxID=34485 RepID=A0ACC2U2X9_9FUNG|nr:hypothetical protein DSO57_1019733 [Entomophthora muscae]
MDKFKSNKSQKKSKLTYKGKGQVTNISSLPLTPKKLPRGMLAQKSFLLMPQLKIVLGIKLSLGLDITIVHLKIKIQKMFSYFSTLARNRKEIIQSYRKLREAIIGENSKVDKFMINVYQESVEACLKAKEFSDDKLFDDELAKGLLTLVEKLYPIYTSSMDKLTSKRKKKMGLYYSYYLFYHLGINSSHLGQVLSACKDPLSGFFLEHPDVKLATQLCISLIHLQYVPFFLNLKACKPSQRLLLKVSVYKSIHLMF